MSTVTTVLTFARAQAQTDSNGLTDTNGIIFCNEALLEFRRRLTAEGVDATGLQESYDSMVGGTGTYLYPTDMAWLKAIELNYTTQVAQDYLMATQVDVSNLPGQSSFSWLRQNADASSPQFNDMGDWFEIFPTPQSGNSQGIRIWYFLEPTAFTAISDNISYPESLDYTILGWRVAASYYRSLNKFEEALGFDQQYELKVKQWINTLGRGTQQPLQATPIQLTGWEF